MNVREIAEREPTISPHFSSINSSAIVVAGTIAGLLSGFWMQLCVNEIAYHNLSLTSGSFVLVRFSCTPWKYNEKINALDISRLYHGPEMWRHHCRQVSCHGRKQRTRQHASSSPSCVIQIYIEVDNIDPVNAKEAY
jgi:hypothetical protein